MSGRGRGFWSNAISDAEYIARYRANTITDERGCWIWQGFKHRRGYGETCYRGKTWRAHRIMLVLTKGPIPADWDACHTCDNPSCINPDHLFGGPRSVNVQDMRAKRRGNHQKKVACIHGHPFDETNTYRDKRGFRQCRTCSKLRQRRDTNWRSTRRPVQSSTPPEVQK